MLPAERHRRIRLALDGQRVVPTEELARTLGASTETIRRDMVALERQGALVRVHGGATAAVAGPGGEAPYEERAGTGRADKAAIGAAAAGLVRPGQTVVIDVGTTALEVARRLPADYRGTVATCSLLAAAELAGRPHVEVLVSGGRLRAGDLALANARTIAFFADLHPDIAFLGSGGLDAAAGLTDYHLDEADTRRTVLAHSAASYALVDTAKFGTVAPHRVCGLDALDGVITSTRPSGALEDALRRAGCATVTGTG